MTRVKICGLTNLSDALAAAEAGADLLGFNFYPNSPRRIAPELCASIALRLRRDYPSLLLVGVFVNAPAEEIRARLEQCHLHLAQLHGDEPLSARRGLEGRAFKAFRGLPAQAEIRAWLRPEPPALLLDAFVPGAYGGSGQVADWTAAAGLARLYPLLLAGGLTPQNVEQAIAQAAPWGVDVASGVEASPGLKDHAKMRLFLSLAASAR